MGLFPEPHERQPGESQRDVGVANLAILAKWALCALAVLAVIYVLMSVQLVWR
jgi:hypothetical protein